MTAGRHRLDGQRRDALRAWLRSLARLIPPIPISRRHRAAGGATAATPQAEAPEVPALPDGPIPGAGTSLQPPDAAARPPWVTWHGPPGTPPPAPRLAPGRDTIAMPAVDAALRVRYAVASEQERDRAVNQ